MFWGSKPQSHFQCLHNTTPVSCHYVNYPLCFRVTVNFTLGCWSPSISHLSATRLQTALLFYTNRCLCHCIFNWRRFLFVFVCHVNTGLCLICQAFSVRRHPGRCGGRTAAVLLCSGFCPTRWHIHLFISCCFFADLSFYYSIFLFVSFYLTEFASVLDFYQLSLDNYSRYLAST